MKVSVSGSVFRVRKVHKVHFLEHILKLLSNGHALLFKTNSNSERKLDYVKVN